MSEGHPLAAKQHADESFLVFFRASAAVATLLLLYRFLTDATTEHSFLHISNSACLVGQQSLVQTHGTLILGCHFDYYHHDKPETITNPSCVHVKLEDQKTSAEALSENPSCPTVFVRDHVLMSCSNFTGVHMYVSVRKDLQS